MPDINFPKNPKIYSWQFRMPKADTNTAPTIFFAECVKIKFTFHNVLCRKQSLYSIKIAPLYTSSWQVCSMLLFNSSSIRIFTNVCAIIMLSSASLLSLIYYNNIKTNAIHRLYVIILAIHGVIMRLAVNLFCLKK